MQVFLKTASYDSLQCEVHGLAELDQNKAKHGLYIPKVIELSRNGLSMEKIITINPSKNDWEKLGEGLAKLHAITKSQFGFKEDNWIGAKPQLNKCSDNWGDFFFKCRLKYQVEMLQDSQLKQKFNQILEIKKLEIVDVLNQHKPKASLLHGDLWSGNVLFHKSGPCLIDPAVYYGDAETDIAMTKIFGGFSESFYSAYDRLAPPASEVDLRRPIYQLYHYLNHLNIFGSSYLDSVERCLNHIRGL